MPTFVLLHGSRHGGWCWRRVAGALRNEGHDVLTPTLTGLGERAHLLNPEVGLSTHVSDLVGVFEYEDLSDVVLVAHSYGGNVACGSLESIAHRVRKLVFLDANMPRSGESLFDLMPSRAVQAIKDLADQQGEGWQVPAVDASYWGVRDPGDIAWVNSKTTPHPLRGYTDAVGETGTAWSHPGMFIECRSERSSNVLLDRPRHRSAADSRFEYRVIDAAHDAMVTAPGQVTKCLQDAAAT